MFGNALDVAELVHRNFGRDHVFLYNMVFEFHIVDVEMNVKLLLHGIVRILRSPTKIWKF